MFCADFSRSTRVSDAKHELIGPRGPEEPIVALLAAKATAFGDVSRNYLLVFLSQPDNSTEVF